MGHVTGVVYTPPVEGWPYIAALFDSAGELLLTRAVCSREAGESLLEEITAECHEPRYPEPCVPHRDNDP